MDGCLNTKIMETKQKHQKTQTLGVEFQQDLIADTT